MLHVPAGLGEQNVNVRRVRLAVTSSGVGRLGLLNIF